MTRTAFIDDVTASVTIADGRQLAYLEVGNPDGPLVLHNHGGPSSRLEARLLAAAAAKNGLRTDLRGPSRHGSVQYPEGADLFRLGGRPRDDRRCAGSRAVRRDGLVGGRAVGAG